MRAFSLPDSTTRDLVIDRLRTEEHVLMLGCGERSVRYRPALTVSDDALHASIAALDRVLTAMH